MNKIISLLLASSALLSTFAPTVSADPWQGQVLAAHNSARAQYGARPLMWSDALYPGALHHAQTCKFGHSNAQFRYGENLYATGAPAGGINDAMGAWMGQAAKYNYNNPVFSPSYGQFTQVVWRSTTHVACAIVVCPPHSTIPDFPGNVKYIVCHYAPPGNYPGQFARNVGRHV
ncbi:hypothetical protein BX616_011004 [Lobosporangium transversale]|uniref:CAP domain-containing protein n=1 Tax=Lobosporangium transversale TaxID=64571 RepID=A0A1Y2GFF2_9FUNG|nr:CAP domain-containing protein [Lobosporangium transversale]KAF9909968.1 hypothetical protein BX616_011004 [Lobosporangium transversale]ORZ09372.1 CAP domain-containing protein [Lobosporangium transversale]|eukprot:XP_021878825.1 CAP domain-containing protein [Lobosporangium transversale]